MFLRLLDVSPGVRSCRKVPPVEQGVKSGAGNLWVRLELPAGCRSSLLRPVERPPASVNYRDRYGCAERRRITVSSHVCRIHGAGVPSSTYPGSIS